MSQHLSQRLAAWLVLASGMGLVLGAYAGEGHGHGSEPAAHGTSSKQDEEQPDIRPNLKASLKAERRDERKDERKDEHGAPAKASAKDTAAEAKGSVSMAELRELIDQKIAEVRARQATAPVVRVKSRAPRPKHDPALMPAMYAPPGQEGSIPVPAGAPRVSSGGHGGAAAHGAAMADAHGAASVVNPQGHDVHWAYSGDTGPESWGMLKPEFRTCMLGKRQSPIDIRDGLPVQLDPIQFEYRPSGFRVIDNGHTVQANVDPGNSIVVQGRRYELVQFHFHRPSEERINGRQFEMVVHLVHKDTEGRLAVIAVLMDQGNAHPMVQLVWNSLPLEKGQEQASSVPMDLNLMLPERKQYFTYMGSLTTPPCTEGVLWMVMKQPAQMSREQIAIFARMYQMNARPIQSAQGRMIKDGQ